MRKLRVTVGRKQIKNGDKGEAESCPIALGVQDVYEALGVEVTANVNGTRTEVIIPAQTLVFTTPNRAAKFIENFDDGNKVQPTTFVLPERGW